MKKWIVIGVVVILIALILFFSFRNARQADALASSGMSAFTLSEKDPGEYRKITLNHLLPFETKQYEVEGIGNLSIMRLRFGPMQLLSFLLSPYEKDAPLMGLDFIYMLHNRRALLEFYDLTEDKEAEAYQDMLTAIKEAADAHSLADWEGSTSSVWYDTLQTVYRRKKGSIAEDKELQALFSDVVRAYAQKVKELPELSGEAKDTKRSLIADYARRLVEEGGTSTDNFKKQLGPDVTLDFFAKVFFGYDSYE